MKNFNNLILILLCLLVSRAFGQDGSMESLCDYYRYQREHQILHYDEDPSLGYRGFVFSEMQLAVIDSFAMQLVAETDSELDKLQTVCSFVQSLPYVSDSASKGQEEYVRYPIETLVDGCGDCEDKTLLLASLLSSLGFDYVLLSYPNHLALAVCCDLVEPHCVLNCDGKQYHYVETTSNWPIGEAPKEYRGEIAELVHVSNYPYLFLRSVEFESAAAPLDIETNCELELTFDNFGPGAITDMHVRVSLVDRMGKRQRKETLFDLSNLPEAESRTERLKFTSLISPGYTLIVEVWAESVPVQTIELKLTKNG